MDTEKRKALVKKYKLKAEYGYCEHFKELLSKYPNRQEHGRAYRYYAKTVRTEEDKMAIDIALENYLKHLTIETWKRPKMCATWFHNWLEWVAWEETESREIDPFEAKL